MFRYLFSFEGINWWTLLGGLGLNFILTLFTAMGGAYLGTNPGTADFYAQFGAPITVVAYFLLTGLVGFVTGKIAGEYQVRHAFMGSLGGLVPLLVVGVLTFTPMALMLAVVGVAGNMNGGMLSVPKPKYTRPDR